ncbi:MAG TPA: hypothetical protein ENK65_03315 [Helicobacteraceae bacterium]|nr:hypothetical protein [Helicobacteraceae bacterium]
MGACGYVTPLNRKKQEIIALALELEEMGELNDFTQLVLEYDILSYYETPSQYEKHIHDCVKHLKTHASDADVKSTKC